MYLHVTSKCNMSCQHCCFDYGNGKKGEDMSLDIFEKCIDFCKENDLPVTLGGGEICLHKNFDALLELCIAKNIKPYIVTNGSIKNNALKLAKLTEDGFLDAWLSYDSFHNKSIVDSMVYFEFKNIYHVYNDLSDLETQDLIYIGRAKQLKNNRNITKTCLFKRFMVLPHGGIKMCGCEDSPFIGNIMENDTIKTMTKLNMSYFKNICHKEFYSNYSLNDSYKEIPILYLNNVIQNDFLIISNNTVHIESKKTILNQRGIYHTCAFDQIYSYNGW